MKTNNEPTICETNKYHTWVKRTLNSMPDDLICAHCGTHALMNLYGKDAMPQTQREHTKTPWEVSTNNRIIHDFKNGSCLHIATVYPACGNPKANAHHIVQCVNQFDQILGALEASIDLMNDLIDFEEDALPEERKLFNKIKQALLTTQKEG